jgi:hypothetical protein
MGEKRDLPSLIFPEGNFISLEENDRPLQNRQENHARSALSAATALVLQSHDPDHHATQPSRLPAAPSQTCRIALMKTVFHSAGPGPTGQNGLSITSLYRPTSDNRSFPSGRHARQRPMLPAASVGEAAHEMGRRRGSPDFARLTTRVGARRSGVVRL